MIIDCDSCTGRGHACGDCVISVFLGSPGLGGSAPLSEPTSARTSEPTPGPAPLSRGVDLDDCEAQALDVLAQAGLVPPLRHVRPA